MTAPAIDAPAGTQAEVWALVQAAQAGDAQAFGQIYRRYADTVFRFVYFRTTNRQLAEDLTSETFLRALKRIDSFTWQGRDIGAWFSTIARNLLADHYKSCWYQRSIPSADFSGTDRADADPLANPEQATLDHLAAVELSGTIAAAMAELSEHQRRCLELRFMRGMSIADTAAELGINEGAAKALQFRATRTLARLIPEATR